VKAYEAITEANELGPNPYGNDLKLRWLRDLDGRIRRELMERREAPKTGEYEDGFSVSESETFGSGGSASQTSPDEAFADTEAVLLVPEPWARDVYVNYLLSRVAQADAEAERYNLYAAFFNMAYGEYAAWYNRTAPLPRRGGWRY
jgi:hypothetical protein